MPNHIHVAVGVVFNPAGQVLVALRPIDKLQGGFWEFPGGKIELNETAEQALARELFEEVDILVIHAQPLVQCQHRFATHQVKLEVFQIREFTGTARGKEGQKIDWVLPQTLNQLALLSANGPIVEAILALT